MSEKTTFVSLRYPLFSGQLSLHRVPKYLRFACTDVSGGRCARTWDALDQPDDEPRAGEYLFAGKLAHKGTLHLDKVVKGRRVGEWHDTASYELAEPQPEQSVMRDFEQWKEWCMDQEAAELDASERGPI